MKEISDYGKLQRKIRTDAKMSIRLLSEKSGVSHSYLSQVENGTRPAPSPDVLSKIAIALNYDYFSLLRTAGHMTVNTTPDYLEPTFIFTMIKEIPNEDKKDFLFRFRETEKNKDAPNANNLERLDFLINSEDSEEEINEYLLSNFRFYAGPSDYLALLRVYRNMTPKEVAECLYEVGVDEYIENENNLQMDSPFLKKWGKVLGLALGVDDLSLWLNNQAGIVLSRVEKMFEGIGGRREQKLNVSFEYPRWEWAKGDKPYEKVEKEISQEEAKQRFLYLENLLTMNENIYFNKKALTAYQRQQLLSIAGIIFNVGNEENNEE
ncbi:helix-turn-helix domain-containing protein [Sporosarcina sp. FA9]|uniref:helix-turn-helix domain-containing protein n=1 Tax=Sporosarcina sp. FA9 TaxID=3413030 RepID=UPI003F65FDC3